MPEALGSFELSEENHKKFKALAMSIYKEAPKEQRRRGDPNNPLDHLCNRASQNIFKQYPELEELKSSLEQISLEYINMTGFICNEVVITDAWLNLGSKNAVLGSHNHLNSYLSGTYYINYNSKLHSNLTFFNDRLIKGLVRNPSFSIPRRNDINTIYNTEEIKISNNEGQVIIWKSHLIHGFTEPNPTDNRFTLSFNIMPKICSDGQIYSFEVNN